MNKIKEIIWNIFPKLTTTMLYYIEAHEEVVKSCFKFSHFPSNKLMPFDIPSSSLVVNISCIPRQIPKNGFSLEWSLIASNQPDFFNFWSFFKWTNAGKIRWEYLLIFNGFQENQIHSLKSLSIINWTYISKITFDNCNFNLIFSSLKLVNFKIRNPSVFLTKSFY